MFVHSNVDISEIAIYIANKVPISPAVIALIKLSRVGVLRTDFPTKSINLVDGGDGRSVAWYYRME